MLDELIKTILGRTDVEIIAIDGFGGAGKSTLADMLQGKLPNSRIIRIDDYIIDKKLNDTADLVGFDRKNVINELVKAKNSDQITILEGISALHPDFDNHIDFKIWIDASLEEANQRARTRDIDRHHEYLRYIWNKSAKAYLRKHKPHKKADYLYKW